MKSNITAKNYASEVALYLSKLLTKVDYIHYEEDSKSVKRLLNDLTESVHFVMPDNGNLLDDNLRGIENMEIRLPYPKISVEYYVQKDSSSLNKNFIGNAPKRVIIATEIPISSLTIESIIPTIPDTFKNSEYIISISSVYFSEKFKGWMPCSVGFLIPSKWDAGKDVLLYDKNNDRIVDFPYFGFCSIELFPKFLEGVKKLSSEKTVKMIHDDLYSEVIVLLELIEALSCSNVKESIHQEASKKNAQRIKSHKKPIWETKFLTLVVNEKQDKRIKDSMTSHASPRQHLRRGHIRRLPSKNIWVNSCVVGNIENGKIEKQYKLRK